MFNLYNNQPTYNDLLRLRAQEQARRAREQAAQERYLRQYQAEQARARAQRQAEETRYRAALQAEEARLRALQGRRRAQAQAYNPFTGHAQPAYGYEDDGGEGYYGEDDEDAYEAYERQRRAEVEARRRELYEQERIRQEAMRREEEARREEMLANMGWGVPRRDTRVPRAAAPSTVPGSTPYGARARTQSPSRSNAQPPLRQACAEAPPRIDPHARAPVPRKYTEDEISATETLQSAFRRRTARKNAFKTLDALAKTFRDVRRAFTPPETIEFMRDGEVVPVSTISVPYSTTVELDDPTNNNDEDTEQPSTSLPKLAFTPASRPLLAYDEELTRLLAKLDAIESAGDRSVRERRRALVRMVEGEASRAEKWRAEVWRRHVNGPEPDQVQEDMNVDAVEAPTQVQDTIPEVVTEVMTAASSSNSSDPTSTSNPFTDQHDDILNDDANQSSSVEPQAHTHEASPPSSTSSLSPSSTSSLAASNHESTTMTEPSPGGVDAIAAELSAPAESTHIDEPAISLPEEALPEGTVQTHISDTRPEVEHPELITSVPLPLSNILGSQHTTSATTLVPLSAQDAADDGSHVQGQRAVHSGFGADLENVPAMNAEVLGALGHGLSRAEEDQDEERGGAGMAERDNEGRDRGVRGASGNPGVVLPMDENEEPRGENADGEEEFVVVDREL